MFGMSEVKFIRESIAKENDYKQLNQPIKSSAQSRKKQNYK